jgi:hypothetical protein
MIVSSKEEERHSRIFPRQGYKAAAAAEQEFAAMQRAASQDRAGPLFLIGRGIPPAEATPLSPSALTRLGDLLSYIVLVATHRACRWAAP